MNPYPEVANAFSSQVHLEDAPLDPHVPTERPSPKSGHTKLLECFLGGLVITTTGVAQEWLTGCTEAKLQESVSKGGRIVLGCDEVVRLHQTILITNHVTLDATWHNTTLDGGGETRLFEVGPGGILTLIHLTLSGGYSDAGGAIRNHGGTVEILDCILRDHTAKGNVSTNGYTGEAGSGGAIHNAGVLRIRDTVFVNNQAVGREGGVLQAERYDCGEGGSALGGALYSASGTVELQGVAFLNSTAVGGMGGFLNSYNIYCAGGAAKGGAIYLESGVMSLDSCQFTNNLCRAGAGLRYAAGGAATGGAIYTAPEGSVSVSRSTFSGNSARSAIGSRWSAGGALFNQGSLMVEDSVFDANVVQGPSGDYYRRQGDGMGGALFNEGQACKVTSATFIGNYALGGDGGTSPGGRPGGIAAGGAVFNQATASIENSTFASNETIGGKAGAALGVGEGSGGDAQGGALANSGTASVLFCTLNGNAATGGVGSPPGNGHGGGLYAAEGNLKVEGSILNASPAGGCSVGMLLDAGYNVCADASVGFTNQTSLREIDPGLTELGFRGGVIPTFSLLPSSPARDAAPAEGCPIRDGRGFTRPIGLGCDIGAVEADAGSPRILTQPKDRRAVSGSSLTMSVEVVGEPPLSLQWRHEGRPIANATGPTLTLAGLSPADAGAYDVEVSNALGLAHSTPVTLEIQSAALPEILTGPVYCPLNRHFYYLTAQSSWLEAEEAGQKLGGHLATIRNPAEQTWIYETFSSFAGIPRHLAIGLHDADPFRNADSPWKRRSEFTWISGEVRDFSFWDVEEPNNWMELGETWVQIIGPDGGDRAGAWNDISDTSENEFAGRTAPLNGVVEIVTPHLVSERSGQENQIRVTIWDGPGQRCQVQISQDLSIWETWKIIESPAAGNGFATFVVPIQPGSKAWFYRAIRADP